MKTVVIIPARYASVRFPGKMLARDPRGRILVQYACEAAQKASRVQRVIVATDDERVVAAVKEWGGEARMTSPKHASGTDRIAEVARDLPEYDTVINIQGDEPQIIPEQIDQIAELIEDSPDCDMSTLVHPIQTQEEYADPNVVKCVFDAHGRALYFSRWPIPYVRDAKDPFRQSPATHYRHVGMYGYRRDFLLSYSSLGRCPLEEAEKLEQLRALYNGHRIRVGVTHHRSIGVDTPQDFEAFCRAVRQQMNPPG
ncbi:MAG TPA: 3-deoxy-manno-octulosonate cytidylyltransferase [Candidatus Brocadiia bacterium]|nr:3-deoxy-manno-octulosonate cytidylyltransferase [Candidatus Brocadiia bacterium]